MTHALSRRGTRASEARKALRHRQVGHHRPDRQAPPVSPEPDGRVFDRARESLRAVVGR